MVSSDSDGRRLEVRLVNIEYGANGINLYRLASMNGEPLPPYEPGAHIDIEIEPKVVRQYSLLWPAPSATEYTVAVQLSESGRGGSKALHYKSVVGNRYEISKPRNHFPLRDSSREYCLLAGGIGITPIVSMYRSLKQRGENVRMFYWTASPESTLFKQELEGDDRVSVIHTRTGAKDVPRLCDVVGSTADATDLYCCGPVPMVDEFERVTAERPPDSVHRERFSAQLGPLTGDSFQVTLSRSGKTLTIGPEESILTACLAAGIDVAYSCEEGVCGACEVKVLAGTVIHRDSVLSPEQQAACKSMMVCCSRGVSDTLVLDL